MEEEGNMRKKIMSALVVLTMLLASVMVMTTFDVGVVDTARGTIETEYGPSSTVYYLLSNNGMVNPSSNLTCGETLTWAFPGNDFDKGDDYIVKVHNGTGWVNLDVSNEEVDDYGNLYIQFVVPGWPELDQSPLGTWQISLWEDLATDTIVQDSWTNITIGNLYYTRMYYQGTEISHLIYNTSYSQADFEFRLYNWSGSKLELQDDTGDEDFDCTLLKGDFSEEESSSNVADGTWEVGFQINEDDAYPDYEVFYWLVLTAVGGSTELSNISIPVKLNMTCTYPTDATWGDTIDIYGYVLDGNGDGIAGYDFRVYAPNNAGSYTLVYYDDTDFSGYYGASIATGSLEQACAGTWVVGTYKTAGAPRPVMTDMAPYVAGFIPYASFNVQSRDDVTVAIENTDDLITGFIQTINVSVKNETWMDNLEYQNMNIHVAEIAGYNETTGWEYSDDDIVQVATSAMYVKSNEKEAYYIFQYHFNETGTGKILVSHEGNLTAIIDDDTTTPLSGFYTYKYGHASMNPNATGSRSFSVVAADSMNLVVTGEMVDAVQVTENPSACTQNQWINGSDTFTLNIYGDSSSDRMNATIEVSGCGLDFTIKEDDPGDAEECTAYPGDGSTADGTYTVQIAPKTAGTLTITATNDTSDESVTKDYTVTGLTGTVTTSVGDDLKITVGTTETVTVTVINGQYAEVTLTYFDTAWTKTNAAATVINNTVGDGTEGEGLNGVFTFIPDTDDIENLGFIVVAAKAGGSNYMYDIIEIEPIYDFTIELVTPTLENATPVITVGLEQELSFRILDANGDDVEEDDPSATVKLIDEDNDENNPLMEWSTDNTGDWSIDQSGDEWQIDELTPWWTGQLVITGQNNTDGIAHAGNLTLDVDYATLTYSPTAATAGIGTENLTVTVTGVDANGDPLPDGTSIYFWCNDSIDTNVGGNANAGYVVDFKDVDTSIDLDEDGMGEFEIDIIGDNQTKINATFGTYNPTRGNRTLGEFNIFFPTFELMPETVYIGQSNMVTITAKDHEGTPLEGINLTFLSSVPGILSAQPDPVQTDADGVAQLSISPLASGKLNVTIARNLGYEAGQLNWTNSVVTDTYLTATSLQSLKITLSKSPIYEGETLTVTIKSGTNVIAGVDVEFAETTVQTDANGQATFTVPDPGVESAVYTVAAEKAGYLSEEKSITVIKIYDVTIIAPTTMPNAGEEFTITILAKGQALAGATIQFNGKTYTSGADGTVTMTAPEKGEYTVTASYEDYTTATATITITEGGGVPGFELLTLIAALGVAFILLRRRR